jgi:GrpB-like predicted nucleotidyltransferase (UPF0157 family)
LTDVSKVRTASIIRAMMEAASTSETSVNVYQTTGRYNPEFSHFHIRRREKLKSHVAILDCYFRHKNSVKAREDKEVKKTEGRKEQMKED